MPCLKTLFPALAGFVLLCLPARLRAQQPANDNCANASVIAISGGGFDYGVFTSATTDLTNATGEAGEYFSFAQPDHHVKSVWYEFTLPTRRSLKVEMFGSNLTNTAVTLYRPAACLPLKDSLSGTQNGNTGGFIENVCSNSGTYRIQVTAPAGLSASVYIKITLSCPSDPNDSKYDCPPDAYAFNSGNPLPQNGSSSSGSHNIACQSIDYAAENDCLPLPDKADYTQSTWYVFKTGARVDLLSFNCNMGFTGSRLGYRIYQGDVRPAGPAGLTQIDCGLAKEDGSTRYIDFPCILLPNTLYSIELLFHKDFTYSSFYLTARQRGETPTGWPKPVQPPVLAANQLGVLPNGGPTAWKDRFDCSARISLNPCPPANPVSGTVTIGSGSNARAFDLATWATFTLTSDANVDFDYTSYNYFLTRIFRKTLGNSCPSPDPATDLVYEFYGRNGAKGCLPAGDYAVQVLAGIAYSYPNANGFWDKWSFGYLGTPFELRFTVDYLPVNGLFMLDAPGAFDPVNAFNPLQDGVIYPAAPAIFICKNTVLPANGLCTGAAKALYREVRIDQDGLLCMANLRTDDYPDAPVRYQFYQADANASANAQNAHNPGQTIAGMTDYLGFCIDKDDNTFNPAGLDTFCTCATAGVYTLVSLGDSANVGKGDAPKFRHRILKTVHDSRANAETVNVGASIPGTYTSQPDVFSCADNLGVMPPCGNRKKLIFRQFYLQAPALVTILETGASTPYFSLFQGQATDPASILTLVGAGCGAAFSSPDSCAPLQPGWYTVVSYGSGPNYTDKHSWDNLGHAVDVGKTDQITIKLDPARTPKFNRPHKAYQAGVTDWTPLPPANPNAVTGKLYPLPTEYFCNPDTPFIADSILPCAAGYNRVAFYVFTITQSSFVQIRNVDTSFYVEVFPFDVAAMPGSLLSVTPVYQCLSAGKDYRQICDLPPGKYAIAIFAKDKHKGATVTPALYIEAVGTSRFDDASDAYDFDLIPPGGIWRNGKTSDVNLSYSSEAPSRDVFYCTTGARNTDPADTRCGTQLNPLIYAINGPKPLFLPGNPPPPVSQPWRTLWYTFVLEGSGTASISVNPLTPGSPRPLIAVYESPLDATQPWSGLKNLGDAALSAGLTLLDENVSYFCDADYAFNNIDLSFPKSGCVKNRVRYFLVVSFDADEPNFPNQAISISIKYDDVPTYPALYDERTTANVLNGLGQTQPPYTAVSLAPGNVFTGPEFSLQCYTKNATDPPGSCSNGGESAWFKFEVLTTGQFYVALQKVGVAGWFDNTLDMSVWQETTPGGALLQLPLSYVYISNEHEWMSGCIGPGTYYLLVRSCSSIDELQPYKAVIKLTDSPGDFCSNAIPLDVTNASPVTASATVDCHTIGTDFGETSPDGMGCLFGPAGKKTTWFRVHVTAGPKVDLNFKFAENLNGSTVTLNHLAYRVFSGSCGALTPVVCSAVGSNVITQNCLGPGDYFVQVALPVKVGSTAVEGTISLTVTATPNTDPNCTPTNPNAPLAGFDFSADCQTISFVNTSTAGADIAYLWQFPGGATSTLASPVWTPPGAGNYAITLTVTNTANNLTATVAKTVAINAPFAAYQPLADGVLCNGGALVLDATVPGATYLWSDNSTAAALTTAQAGTYWVLIKKDGCEKRDTAIVTAVDAHGTVNAILCPGDTLSVGNQLFYAGQASGTVTLPAAHPLGCDSILSVALSFYPPASQNLDTTLCAGLTLSIGGQTFSAANPSGQVTLPNQAPHGCDLSLNVNATFTPPPDFSIEQTLCKGETFTYHGETFSETHPSATIILPASAPGGCDTTVVVSVAFYYPDTPLVVVQRCANQTFTFGDSTFTPQHPGGWVTLSGATTQYGCDSVVQVEVAFLPTVAVTEQPALCAGRSIVIHGQTFSQANPAGVILVPGEGGDCDTVLTVSLHFLPDVLAVRHPQICTGRTITLYGQTFSETNPSGVIQVPGLNGDCDTVLTVSVTFLPNVLAALQPTVCAGKSITIYGQTFSEANPTGVIHIPGQGNDCDTLLSVTPHFLPKNEVWLTPNLCPGQSVKIGGKIFDASNPSDTVMFVALSNGCDSIVHVDVNLLPPAAGVISGTYCHGDTVLLFGQAFTAAKPGGVVVRPGVAPNGCDSIWTVDLAFKPFQSAATAQTACLGTSLPLQAPPGGVSYQWQDGSVQPVLSATQSGTYWVQSIDADGCVIRADTFALQFDALAPPQAAGVETCAGENAVLAASGSTGVFEWYDAPSGGNHLATGAVYNTGPLNAAGTYWVEAVQNAVAGCVSARVPVPVVVHPQVLQTLTATICETETYPFGDQHLAQPGVYTQNLNTIYGCDSTLTLTLTVLDTFLRKSSAVICHDGSFQLPSGQVVSQAGVYSGKWTTQNGCDSTWEVTVTQRPLLIKTDLAVLCADQTLALPWGDPVTQPGAYTKVYLYAAGCDSLHWTVNVQAAIPIQPGIGAQSDFNGFAVSCADAADGRAGVLPVGGAPPYAVAWSTGGAGVQLSGLAAGTYTATITDAQGCTAAQTLTLLAPPKLALDLAVTDPVCPGEAMGRITAAASGGASPYLYALDGGSFVQNPVFQGLASGLYQVAVQDANGCETDSTAAVAAPADIAAVFDPASVNIHFGDSLLLTPLLNFAPDSIAWTPATAELSCTDCLDPWVKPLRSAVYRLVVWNADGCSTTAAVEVRVDRRPRLYVPTAFNPNGSGQNDFFQVFAGPEIRILRRLTVYDRWGETAFDARDFLPDAPIGRWDGRLHGQDFNPGVFVWVCVFELSDGTVETLSGDVTLLR